MTHSLNILGGGNMGGAIARALANNPAWHVTVVEPEENRCRELQTFGLRTDRKSVV